jgi:hypothetical protein
MASEAKTYEGSCLCGGVRYRATGPLGIMSHCHCTDCRKAAGAAFATYIGVVRDRLAVLAGRDLLVTHVAEPGTRRLFCRQCGSILFCETTTDPDIYFTPATLDTPLDKKPEYHIFVRSKVAWHDIKDGLPQYQAYDPESSHT